MNLRTLPHNAYKKLFAQHIEETLGKFSKKSPLNTPEEIYSLISKTPNLQMGHLAFPCFSLSRSLKMSPQEISLQLEKWGNQNCPTPFSRCRSVGPYLNIYFDLPKLSQDFLNSPPKKTLFFQAPPKTMVEYSQPNTHKELHVGHMRNLCLGDALVRIFKYTGIPTLKATYPGDMGTHVGKCLWFLKYHHRGELPTEDKGEWLGKLYSQAERKWQTDKLEGKEEENKNLVTGILSSIKKGEGEFFELWKMTREWSFDQMKDLYQWAHVNFDQWYTESEVDEASLELVAKYFKKGLFVKDQGAIGISLAPYKLGFCLLQKSDGQGLYATKDLELARRKFEDFQIEQSIYVVDKRQSLHFQQVFKTLELMGYEQAKKCFHLAYDYVELPTGAMSSRLGNIIPIKKLINEMESMIQEKYLSSHDWTEEKKKNTAHMIAEGAIKYGMNSIDNNKKIIFKMEEWLKLDGESGPYIQYVHARISSIIKKLSSEFESVEPNYSLMVDPTEEILLTKLVHFHDEVEAAAKQYRPSIICTYLYEIAKAYNSFYAKCSVSKSEPGLARARFNLSKKTANTLKIGLGLIGVTAPEDM